MTQGRANPAPTVRWETLLDISNIKPQKKSMPPLNYGNAIIGNTLSATNNHINVLLITL
jgi:hypothetical protein